MRERVELLRHAKRQWERQRQQCPNRLPVRVLTAGGLAAHAYEGDADEIPTCLERLAGGCLATHQMATTKSMTSTAKFK
jgi:hypothetical protein